MTQLKLKLFMSMMLMGRLRGQGLGLLTPTLCILPSLTWRPLVSLVGDVGGEEIQFYPGRMSCAERVVRPFRTGTFALMYPVIAAKAWVFLLLVFCTPSILCLPCRGPLGSCEAKAR